MQLHFSTEPTPQEWSDWRWQLKHAARSLEDISDYLGIPVATLRERQETAQRYPIFVTPYYLSLAANADLSDPVLQQCLPSPAELENQCGGAPDALAEDGYSPVPRLVHRYPDRALFITGNFCAVHCRHCMRKRDWAKTLPAPTAEELGAACQYLRQHPEVREVLISGGDPLMLSEEALAEIIQSFSDIPTIEMLRLGSRVPVALPQRITPRLSAILGSGKPLWLATHFNHPQELSKEIAEAVKMLMREGVVVVNQSVLLKGINDDAAVLAKLFTGLLQNRIKPYYLFHGDPIEGVMHFRTGLKRGLEIMNQLRGRVSGMAIPAFSFDLPGGAGKIRLQPEQVIGIEPETGAPIFESYEGKRVPYPN